MTEEKKVWTNEEIKMLISMYEENPVLWNVQSPSYRNRNKKQEALQLIATSLNTDSNEITRKLHNLRSQFMQELRKIKMKKSGAGSDEMYISNWPYFSDLKFIQRTMDTSETTDTLNSQSQPCSQEPGPSQVHRTEPNPAPRKKRSNDSGTIISAEIKKAVDVLNHPADDDQIYGDYIASEMRQIKNPANKRKLKRLINKAVMRIADADAAEQESQSPSHISSPSYSTYSSNHSSTPLPSPFDNSSGTHFTQCYFSLSDCTGTDTVSDIRIQQL